MNIFICAEEVSEDLFAHYLMIHGFVDRLLSFVVVYKGSLWITSRVVGYLGNWALPNNCLGEQ